MARKIIIDTDPGQDDAVAILTALASPDDFDILGIAELHLAFNVDAPRANICARLREGVVAMTLRRSSPC